MVVICPNCGREIFSDPDSCVMCGWTRDAPMPREGRGRRMEPARRPPPRRQRPPYQGERDERGYERPMRREPDYRALQRRENRERPRDQYGGYEPRYPQRGPYEDERMQRRYQDDYRQERQRPYPPQRAQRPYYDERREPPPRRYERDVQPRRYGYEAGREPPRDMRERESGEPGRNYCPNCGREILTDPDNCVLCGWSRESEPRRPPPQEQRRGYPRTRNQGYQKRPYQEVRRQGPEPRNARNYPPEGWERRIREKTGGRVAPPRDERRSWYKPEIEGREPKRKGAKDRYVCENCGNPSLQFFADGLGRCPACDFRFRFSARSQTVRSKQKHKQFICSNCDNKNLQFFLDGSGICPQCKREFKWKK